MTDPLTNNLSSEEKLALLLNAVERFMLQHHVQHDHHDEPTVWEHMGFSADNALAHALAYCAPGRWVREANSDVVRFYGLSRDVYGDFHYTVCPLCREGQRVSERGAMEVKFTCGSTWSEERRSDRMPENWDVKCERKVTR